MIEIWKNWQRRINGSVSWLLLAIAILIVLNIVARYVWNRFTIANYELILYLHIWVILISLSYAMQEKAHIGIDIVAARLRNSTRNAINLALTVVLALPVALLIVILGGEYALSSWQIWEKSRETGGLDYVYISKSAIAVGGILLLIQSLVIIVECVAKLRNDPDTDNDSASLGTDPIRPTPGNRRLDTNSSPPGSDSTNPASDKRWSNASSPPAHHESEKPDPQAIQASADDDGDYSPDTGSNNNQSS